MYTKLCQQTFEGSEGLLSNLGIYDRGRQIQVFIVILNHHFISCISNYSFWFVNTNHDYASILSYKNSGALSSSNH